MEIRKFDIHILEESCRNFGRQIEVDHKVGRHTPRAHKKVYTKGAYICIHEMFTANAG